MAEPKVQAAEKTGRRVSIDWSAMLAGVLVAVAVAVLLDLLGLAFGNIMADPFELTDARLTALVLGGMAWIVLANVLALEVGIFVVARAPRFSSHHRGALLGLTIWSLAFVVAGIGSGGAAAATLMNTSEATMLAVQGDEEISQADLQRAVDASRDIAADLAWWGVASLGLGAAGAAAGGHLGRAGPATRAASRITNSSLLTPHRWVKLDS